MSEQQGAAPRIVVGVDGSAPSRAALRWAVEQARLTGAAVEAMIAWHFPYIVAGYGWAMEVPTLAETAQKVLNDSINAAVDPVVPVRVIAKTIEGSPPRVLLDAARGADLLVVGSRGMGRLTEALLGSTSQHCVHHAPCPVVIIREQARGS